MTKVAVILAGCGHLDGAEIREAVLSLLYLDQHGADVTMFALDEPQHHTVHHLNQQEEGVARNMLAEAARIARGQIHPMQSLDAKDFDALVIPGGFGVAKNFSDLAFKGAQAQVHPEFARVVRAFHAAQKPIGAICIAPAVVALALKGIAQLTVTVGECTGTAVAIESFGAKHKVCASDEIAVDEANHLVTCSAYMRDDRLSNIAKGIEKLVVQTLLFARKNNHKAA